MRTDRHGFPIKECTRCGGTGHHSYCSRYGTRCFKCGGSGLQLASKKVVEAYDEWRAATRRASHAQVADFAAGDVVTRQWRSDFEGPAKDATWQTVATAVETDETCGWSQIGNGEKRYNYYYRVTWSDGASERLSSGSVFYRQAEPVDPAPYVAQATARAPRKRAAPATGS